MGIEIKNLNKRFKDITAVKDLSFSVNDGEVFALLGENGAGKTTLIKIITGLIEADSGEVYISGLNLKENRDKLKGIINVSPQETAVAKNLTVKENLVLSANLYGIDKESTKKAQEIIDLLSLKEVENKYAKNLSGGTARRLSIGMALITDPKILFLDEPTLGLDVKARIKLWDIIENLKGKTTVILTTHYLEEAERLADRIAVMSKGELKAIGSLEELSAKTGKSSLEEIFLSFTGDEL